MWQTYNNEPSLSLWNLLSFDICVLWIQQIISLPSPHPSYNMAVHAGILRKSQRTDAVLYSSFSSNSLNEHHSSLWRRHQSYLWMANCCCTALHYIQLQQTQCCRLGSVKVLICLWSVSHQPLLWWPWIPSFFSYSCLNLSLHPAP